MGTGGSKQVQPHDALMRAVLSNPVDAGAEVRSVLPPELVARLDLDHLELQSGTFVTEELSHRQTDVLFRTTMRSEQAESDDRAEQTVEEDNAYIYFLIEHQSTPEPLMAHRMLGYQQRIRDRHLAHHGGATVPIVIPIVIYQGHRLWNAPIDVADVTAADDQLGALLGDYLPRARYYLDDLTRFDDNALRARPLTPTLRVVYVSLRRGPGDTDFTAWLPDWRSEIVGLSDQTLSMLVSYLVYVGNTTRERLRAFAATTGPHTEEIIMTAAGRLITEAWAEGEARGRAEGEARGRVEGEARGRVEGEARGETKLLLKQLTTRYGTLDPDVRERVENATIDQVELWSTRLVQGNPTLDDILG